MKQEVGHYAPWMELGSRRGIAEEQRNAEVFNKYELWVMSYEVGVV